MDEDNLYEMDMRNLPEPDYRNVQCSPPAPPRTPVRNTQVIKSSAPGNNEKLIRILLIVITAMLAFLTAMVVWNSIATLQAKEKINSISQAVGVGSTGNAPSATVPPANNPTKSTPTSCLELRQKGQSGDGTYFIQPSHEFSEERVFCDMTTDGGGWTLVASVHDNDIKKKCDSDDLWSDYLVSSNKEYLTSANWQNEMTFGDVHHATKRDYKNVAYSKLNASDVMILHVQISLPIEFVSSVTKFRYRTTDSFLRDYGGNLYSLYKNHFPLTPAPGDYPTHEVVQRILTALEVSRDEVKGFISDWYDYTWNKGSNYIYHHRDIFNSYGNGVNFYSRRCSSGVSYGTYGSCNDDFYWLTSGETARTSPFFAVAVFYNGMKNNGDYRLRVRSNRVAGNKTKTDGVLLRGNYKLQYHVRQTTHGTVPTLCEFHFMASNVEDWKSIEPTSYSQSYEYTGSSFGYGFQASGTPQNIVMGYVLLTRSAGKAVTDDQIRNVAKYVMDKISTIPTLFQTYLHDNSSLKVPVTFDKGSSDSFLESVPPNYKTLVDSGFVQFRAYNLAGYPNAFCPGVKANTISPEYVCIGGISNNVATKGTCGDFAGWEGTSDDSGSGSTAIGSAHSHADIYSTILIFYR